ncbi:hypothetical protein D7V86_25865 [bacterium D16-51]|nr:hypothetical protein D7V96_21465 [bacterium D16-59]RKI52480.1 hypothetical protein D7V86_25865 [bacterium D16-51]
MPKFCLLKETTEGKAYSKEISKDGCIRKPGILKRKMVMTDDFDVCNDKIAEMFRGRMIMEV